MRNFQTAAIIKAAQDQGWAVSQTSKAHVKMVPPDPSLPIVIAAGTTSDQKSFRSLLCRARRSGLKWPPTNFKIRHHKGEIA